MIVLTLDYALVALFFGLNALLQFHGLLFSFGFFYNMMYFRHLFTKGYRPADQRSRNYLPRHVIGRAINLKRIFDSKMRRPRKIFGSSFSSLNMIYKFESIQLVILFESSSQLILNFVNA